MNAVRTVVILISSRSTVRSISVSTPGRRIEISTVVPLGPRTRLTTSSVVQPLVSSQAIASWRLAGDRLAHARDDVVAADAGTIGRRSFEQLGHRDLAVERDDRDADAGVAAALLLAHPLVACGSRKLECGSSVRSMPSIEPYTSCADSIGFDVLALDGRRPRCRPDTARSRGPGSAPRAARGRPVPPASVEAATTIAAAGIPRVFIRHPYAFLVCRTSTPRRCSRCTAPASARQK